MEQGYTYHRLGDKVGLIVYGFVVVLLAGEIVLDDGLTRCEYPAGLAVFRWNPDAGQIFLRRTDGGSKVEIIIAVVVQNDRAGGRSRQVTSNFQHRMQHLLQLEL